MSKHVLTMIAIAMAVCLVGCTDDTGDDATVEDAAASQSLDERAAEIAAKTEAAPAAPESAGEAAAAPAATTEPAEEAPTPITMAKLDGVDVEAACAKCAYKLATECMLAIKTDGKAYIVDGTDIISDDVGLCSATRPAKVTGAVTDDTHFLAEVFEFTDGK